MVNCFTKYLTMHCIARTKNVMIKMSALKNLTIGHPGPTVRGPVIHFEKLDILAQGPTVQGQTVRGPNVQGSICPEPLLYRNHYHQCHHPHHHHHTIISDWSILQRAFATASVHLTGLVLGM